MRCWCWQGDHYETGQYPRLMQMTSARVSAEVISRPPTISVSRPFQPRSPSIYDPPSTACLTRLQAPAMRGGQRIAELRGNCRSLSTHSCRCTGNSYTHFHTGTHIHTGNSRRSRHTGSRSRIRSGGAEVTISEAAAPEAAITESTTTKFATAAKFAATEFAGHAAATESAGHPAATESAEAAAA